MKKTIVTILFIFLISMSFVISEGNCNTSINAFLPKGENKMKLFKRVQSLIAKKTGTEPFAPQSAAEIAALDNNALISALCDHFLRKENHESPENFWQGLNESSKIAYSAQNYEMEVNNGGLQQYLENSSSMTVPYLSKALKYCMPNAILFCGRAFCIRTTLMRPVYLSLQVESHKT